MVLTLPTLNSIQLPFKTISPLPHTHLHRIIHTIIILNQIIPTMRIIKRQQTNRYSRNILDVNLTQRRSLA